MSTFDGTKEPLSYGQALCIAVAAIPLGSEERNREVLRAIQTEHNLLPPDPDIAVDEDAELHALRQRKADKDRSDEKARLRAELGDDTPPTPASE